MASALPQLLHLVPDDKFVDMALREFEAVAPGRHAWLMYGGSPPLRYVRDPRVECLDPARLAALLAATDAAAVVIHAMSPEHLGLLGQIAPHCQVVWLGFGYDYYGLITDAFPDGLLGPETARLAARLDAARDPAGHRRHEPCVLAAARPYPRPTPAERQALTRVDIFSPVLQSEHRLACRHEPALRARYVRWNYGTVEDDYALAGAGDASDGPNLLVGNSASPSNNHLELFELIARQVDLRGRQLIVPLSYGDPAYRDCILAEGRARFGEAFVPLIEFMPRERYITLLASCGHVLMNHVRQQALGNLYISGLLGARLHLHPRSPLGPFLRAHGLEVGQVDALDLRPLGSDARRSQVAQLHAHFGRDAQRARTAALIEAACQPRGG